MYNAIIQVHETLQKNDIPHEFRKLYDGYQIILPSGGDIIEHFGSYGHEEDKMEVIGIDWTVLKQYSNYDKDDVLGYLTVDEVLKMCYYDYMNNIKGYMPM